MKPSLHKPPYPQLLLGLSGLLKEARRAAARAVNSTMTAVYWEIGRQIVVYEQGGKRKADYGDELLERLADDLTTRFGRGFSRRNLQNMRSFYLEFPPSWIWQTLSAKSGLTDDLLSVRQPGAKIRQTASAKTGSFTLSYLAQALPLPWSHYVLLMARSQSPEAKAFYHAESLRGGWSVRQLDRQMSSLFYERIALSKNKAAMLKKGSKPAPDEALEPEEEIRDPLVLEFLNLKDEYSESDLEAALIRHLETFLLELGGDLAFVGRQRRLRIGNEWYRVDLLFFHRRLRSLVVIDLKLGKFTHGDAGQMHLYLNYAREHWVAPGENPPVGLILCAAKDKALAHYALENLPQKVMAREYRLVLPDEKKLAAELMATRKQLEMETKWRKKSGPM